MGHILNSSRSSDEYDDIEYKQCKAKNTIINQVSPSSSEMRSTFPNVAETCDRSGVCYILTAILINATLKYMGIPNKKDSSKVVDSSKIQRERIDSCSDGKMSEDTFHRSMAYTLTAEKTNFH
ncbi:hypothetical protein AVEN_241222-1 [Araneus ventricosus]|uniref:Uncharacterized protein n=1 Tax=Araneus ventricosus TaxID=182803 RepID=A0A4Y2D0J9_ARAVE|nr:hypothetical protein AVEN_241222-1 [Araneus ventricosus]